MGSNILLLYKNSGPVFEFHTSEKPDGRKKCADAKTLKILAKLLAVTVRSASSNVHFGKEESTSLSFTDY